MNAWGILQIGVYWGVLLLCVRPLGLYMAQVYEGRRTFLEPVLRPLERGLYRWMGVRPDMEMNWQTYAQAVLTLNAAGFLFLYGLLRLQGILPFNPQGFSSVTPDLAFNTAVSFVTNTNWQSYSGETTLSYLSQMAGLTVQNFISAATGMAVLIALIRGLARHSADTLGNFWVDLTRGILYLFMPLSMFLTLALVSQGTVQTFTSYQTVNVLQPSGEPQGTLISQQVLATGPAAAQIAIKQLGTNGGGFFNTNSAHPLENPTPLSNFLEMSAILLIPAAACYTFGQMVGDTRQGRALLVTMLILLLVPILGTYAAEAGGNPLLTRLGVDQTPTELNPGGNLEGKEIRFGTANSALWAAVTTAASNGSVNAMHDSFMPLGGLAPMLLMQLGEVVFGGVGSGLYGMLAFVIVAVFVAGLMVGRTPEYLGKKIEVYEMKMAALIILIMPLIVLGFTALAVMVTPGKASVFNPGPHGFSEILYAFTSTGNNNGSAFAGLNANTPFYNLAGGLAMLISRYWLILPTLALAGSLVRKKRLASGAGTLPTHTPLFTIWLIGIVLIVAALNFIPALALGPIVEYLTLVK